MYTLRLHFLLVVVLLCVFSLLSPSAMSAAAPGSSGLVFSSVFPSVGVSELKVKNGGKGKVVKKVSHKKSAKKKSKKVARSSVVFGLNTSSSSHLSSSVSSLGVSPGIVGVFTGFTDPFPVSMAAVASSRKSVLMVSWEPGLSSGGAHVLSRVAAGEFDDYIRAFAVGARDHSDLVLVRFAAEMNGDWNPWSPGLFGNSVSDFRAAYRRVVEVSRSVGAFNMSFGFNPIVAYPTSTSFVSLWPGEDVVDWVGLDGYNWGRVKPVTHGWQSFSKVFGKSIRSLRRLSSKPLILAEIGSAPGKRKAAWVRDVFVRTPRLGVVGVVWFDFLKETDWRLGFSAYVRKAVRSQVRVKHWVRSGDVGRVRLALKL